MKLAILLLILGSSVFAGSWTGFLVDADCYTAAVRNVNPNNTSLASRDLSGNLRSCRPRDKTKSFSIVQTDWSTLTLDAAGDAKAQELVRSSKGDSAIQVTVTGKRHKNTIAVASLSRAD